MKYIVELQKGVWLAGWNWPWREPGDEPVRTLVRENALRLKSVDDAFTELAFARHYKPFINARVYEEGEKMSKLRVWWMPQLPGELFSVPVSSVDEGVKIIDVLGKYDNFQLENNIKPDYANAGGIEMYDDDLGDWVDWEDPDTGESDPVAFIENMRNEAKKTSSGLLLAATGKRPL